MDMLWIYNKDQMGKAAGDIIYKHFRLNAVVSQWLNRSTTVGVLVWKTRRHRFESWHVLVFYTHIKDGLYYVVPSVHLSGDLSVCPLTFRVRSITLILFKIFS